MVRPGIRGWFRLRARSPEHIASQVDEEIGLHIELRARELEAGGMSAEAARSEAERRFGEITRARLKLQRRAQERERRMSMQEWLDSWRHDFRYSARSLAREPLVALVIVLTLALGIGANATMFGIVDRLLLRGPEHVTNSDELRRVYVSQLSWQSTVQTMAITNYVTYTLLRDRSDLFAGAAAYRIGSARSGSGVAARELTTGWVSADMFPLLGVQPALGRFFTAEEDRPKQAQQVAVLDWGHWQEQFGGTPDALGKTITVQDKDYTIIGVAPRGFTGPELRPVQVWVPFSTGFEPTEDWPVTWNAAWLTVIARLAPGVSPELAAAEATRMYRAARPESRRGTDPTLSLQPLSAGPSGEETREVSVSRWLAGVSLIVLLVACANVTNLLLARAVRRRREVAVRLALGVSRARLARLLLSESLLLAFLGGVLAIALAYWGGQFLRAALLPGVQWGSPVDLRVLVFSLLAVLVTGTVIGLAPVLQSRTRDLTETLKMTSLRAASGRSRLRSALTVLQAAFSVVLLVGAGLFVQSLWHARNVQYGFEPDRVLAIWADHPSTDEELTFEEYAARDAARDLEQRVVLDRLLAHPGVQNAALALGAPMQSSMTIDLKVPGLDSLPRLPGGGPYVMAVSPEYFATMGTRIVRGRGIVRTDGKGAASIAVVNTVMAEALWPGEEALGKCILIGAEEGCVRVVGLAEDVKRGGLRSEPSMQYYVPVGQQSQLSGTQLLVRPRGDAAEFIPELRTALHELDPVATHFSINHLQTFIEPSLRPWRLGATMFLVFGGLALLIAAIGLYSVVAYGVAQRRTELGVRIALGARAPEIVRMVLRQGLALVIAGIVVGAALSWAGGRAVESLLFEQPARDPRIFAAVALTLLLVAVLATVLPARRAGRTSPLEALRTE